MTELELVKKENDKLKEQMDALHKMFDLNADSAVETVKTKIANSVSGIYKDYAESIDDEMDSDLGEFYKALLTQTFKVLKSNGCLTR